ncbi:MAG: hypothetical protein K0M45_05585 [Candidatus Paracaedibacteraceae bacterium]|nr:hypothetical protein [Candidatus Paracaedibacteraceae bacterium]
MAVFRKIVSSLVVVSYVKMQILTSFAMEQPPHFKIQVERRLDVQDQLDGLILNLSQKKQDEDAYEVVQTDFLKLIGRDFSTLPLGDNKGMDCLEEKKQEFSENVLLCPEELEAVEWQTSKLGKIVVGYDGQVTLKKRRLWEP